jgi:hypothetical protein
MAKIRRTSAEKNQNAICHMLTCYILWVRAVFKTAHSRGFGLLTRSGQKEDVILHFNELLNID